MNGLMKKKDIKYELSKKHFKFQRLSDMLKSVCKTNDKKKNSKLVNIIKIGLSDLKNEIEDMSMSEEEKEIEKPSEIVDIVEKILNSSK